MSERIDDEQRIVTEAPEKAIAVLAGPGSGKTRVLSYRARHLLKTTARSKALLLTFTNKAAAEMKSRALKAAAVASDRIVASTFHAFAQGVLRVRGHLVGIPGDFEILDREDQNQMRRDAAQRAQGKDHGSEWSRCRARREQPAQNVQDFGESYQAIKLAEGVVDFDDLLAYTVQLFESRPEVATAYGTRYSHLLLDEFQDTNALQFALIRSLAAHAKTVSIFADDDQAIFRFAGADSENIARFVGELRAKEYPLTVNYRCREKIVERANLLIQADPSASGRQMRAYRDGGTVAVRIYDTPEEEARETTSEIGDLLKQGIKPESISILVRSEFRVETLLRQLISANVPLSNWLDRSHESRERRLLRICLAVTRDILNARHCTRLSEFFNFPPSDERNTEAFLRPQAHLPGVQELLAIRDLARENAPVDKVVGQVQIAVDAVDSELAHSLTSILDGVRAFQQHDPEFTLEHLLDELSLGTSGGAPTEGGGVKLASLHRTKGLQWPHVFIVGMEEETLPDHRSLDDEEDLRQERRLCFVGVCRAEDSLVLTRVRALRGYRKRPSRFLREMKLDVGAS